MKRTKITDEMLAEAVINSKSVMEVLRYLNLKEAGGTHSHYSCRIIKLNLDTSHFERYAAKGKISTRRKSATEILVLRVSGPRQNASRLKRSLIESGVEHKCNICSQPPAWFGNPLTLDVDHINENWLDDRLENLRFLCPNCHSQFSRNLLAPVTE